MLDLNKSKNPVQSLKDTASANEGNNITTTKFRYKSTRGI